MSGAGLASAIKRRTRPPEEQRSRQVSINESNNVSQQSQTQKQAFNPTQILYNHAQKIKQIEELINGKTNLDGQSTDIQEFNSKITVVEEKMITNHDTANKNLMFVLKNMESTNHTSKSISDNLEKYKSENEQKMTDLMHNFSALNDILMKSLEEFKNFNNAKEDIKNEVVAELIRQSNLSEEKNDSHEANAYESPLNFIREEPEEQATEEQATEEQATEEQATEEQATEEQATDKIISQPTQD